MSSSLIERIKAAYIPSAGKDILNGAVQGKDLGAEWIIQPNYYDWYLTVAEVVQPRMIGEIGVRFGYSLLSMAKWGGACVTVGWDLESYEAACLVVAKENLRKYGHTDPLLIAGDTQKLTTLDMDGQFNLFHVDGDHTFGGAIHDCDLAWAALKPGGVLIADDMCHTESTRDAVLWFAKHKGVECPIIPTYGGLAVMEKPL